jgi:hypothetical protein
MAPACDRSTCDGQVVNFERLIDGSGVTTLAFERGGRGCDLTATQF